MGFRYIKTYNYRNLQNAKVTLPGDTVYLVGENGQGKTNFLEAIYLLCFGSPFRTRLDRQLITHGRDEMAVIGLLEKDSENLRISCKISGKKQIDVNGKAVKDRKELLRNTPCILFSHEDIGFVKGAPERKRWFLNQTIGLFDPVFIDDLRRYNRILKMRNACLKERRSQMLDVLDLQLVRFGLVLMEKRRHLAEEFSRPFREYFSKIAAADTPVSLIYQPSWILEGHPGAGAEAGAEADFGAKAEGKADAGTEAHPGTEAGVEAALAALRKTRRRDLRFGTSTSGPHRDSLGFFLERREYTKEASTGQLRLMSLIMRITQAGFYSQKTGKKPILLLDDVLLELDPQKRRRLMDCLPDYDQAIFTFLPEEKILENPGGEGRILSVKEGFIQ